MKTLLWQILKRAESGREDDWLRRCLALMEEEGDEDLQKRSDWVEAVVGEDSLSQWFSDAPAEERCVPCQRQRSRLPEGCDISGSRRGAAESSGERGTRMPRS